MTKEVIKKYGNRVKYSEKEFETFHEGGHRIRHIERISEVAPLYSIEAEVIKSRNCNSGHICTYPRVRLAILQFKRRYPIIFPPFLLIPYPFWILSVTASLPNLMS